MTTPEMAASVGTAKELPSTIKLPDKGLAVVTVTEVEAVKDSMIAGFDHSGLRFASLPANVGVCVTLFVDPEVVDA